MRDTLKVLLMVGISVGITYSLYRCGHDYNELHGIVRVIDGDTIEFIQAGKVVRLAGIDAPEAKQPCVDRSACGLMATSHLIQLIAAGPVACTLEDRADKYGRRVGTCKASDGSLTLNEAMVLDGYAVAYFTGHYNFAESIARSHKKGLWAHGGFEQPNQYRLENKDTNAQLWPSVPTQSGRIR